MAAALGDRRVNRTGTGVAALRKSSRDSICGVQAYMKEQRGMG